MRILGGLLFLLPLLTPIWGAQKYQTTVISNHMVSTFIRELTLKKPENFEFAPGDYIRLAIPSFTKEDLGPLIAEDSVFQPIWTKLRILELNCVNISPCKRSYSIASGPNEEHLKFNIRIALPPSSYCQPGKCQEPLGVGSAYAFQLKPDDVVTLIGPFRQNFSLQAGPSVYLARGSGLAPVRSHVLARLESEASSNLSVWYSSRSQDDLYYHTDFQKLAALHPHFKWYPVLRKDDTWEGLKGEALDHFSAALATLPNLQETHFYICGPHTFVEVAQSILTGAGIAATNIHTDDFGGEAPTVSKFQRLWKWLRGLGPAAHRNIRSFRWFKKDVHAKV